MGLALIRGTRREPTAVAHSTRSVVEALRVPDLTTTPRRLMSYGYVAVTVTSDPWTQVELTVTPSLPGLRSAAERRTRSMTTAWGLARSRLAAPCRPPARTEAVSVTYWWKTIPNRSSARRGRTMANSVSVWPSCLFLELLCGESLVCICRTGFL